MVGPTALVAVRHERAIPIAVHETQRRNLMAERLANRLICHPQIAEIHRKRIRVVELDEVLKERAAGTGQPFIDAQCSLGPGGRGDVSRAERRCAQAPLAIRLAADGKIRKLPAELHRVEHARAIRRTVHEVNTISIPIDTEAEVQAAGGIRIVRKQHSIRTSRQRGAGRDGVFARVIEIVRQAQPGEIDGRRAAVVELDVIRRGAFVVHGAFVAGQHLVDDHAAQAGEHRPRPRYRRVRIGLPGAGAVPTNDVHRVMPVRQTAQSNGLADEPVRAPCAVVHAVAILRDVRTADIQRGTVQIRRRTGFATDRRAHNDRRGRKRGERGVHPACGVGLHRVDGSRRHPIPEHLIHQREEAVGIEEPGQLMAVLGVIQRLEIRVVEETADIGNPRGREEDVGTRAAARAAEDRIEVVRHDDKTRIEEAAIHVVIVIRAVGQGRLVVVHEVEHGEVTHPQLDVRVPADGLNVLVRRRGVRIEREEEI